MSPVAKSILLLVLIVYWRVRSGNPMTDLRRLQRLDPLGIPSLNCLPLGNYEQTNKAGHTYQLTHLHLVLAWPPGFCKHYNCWNEVDRRKFYLHGIWPANEEGKHMHFCDAPFHPDSTAQPFEMMGPMLIKELHQYWPSYSRPTQHQTRSEASRQLWKHEYLRHGTCAKRLGISLIGYFELGLKLRKMDFEASLLTAGILTGPPSSWYTASDFSNALQKDFGELEVAVSCHRNTQDLIELIMCIDIVTLKLTKCPKFKNKFKCKDATVEFFRI